MLDRQLRSKAASDGEMVIRVSEPLNPSALISQLKVAWGTQTPEPDQWGAMVADILQLVAADQASDDAPL